MGLSGTSSSSLNSGLWNCVYFHPLRPQDSQWLNRKREIEYSVLCFFSCFRDDGRRIPDLDHGISHSYLPGFTVELTAVLFLD